MGRMSRRVLSGAVAAMALGSAGTAMANQFADAWLLAAPDNGSGTPLTTYSSSLTVTAGEVLDYEIQFGMKSVPPSITNTFFGATMTTVIGPTKSVSTDGFGTYAFDLGEASNQHIQANFTSTGEIATHPLAIATSSGNNQDWSIGTGANAGELVSRGNGNSDVSYIVGVHKTGVYTAATPEIVYGNNLDGDGGFAQMTIASALAGSTSTVFIQAHASSFDGDTTAGSNVNGSFAMHYNSPATTLTPAGGAGNSENSADPMICYHGLTLVTAGSAGPVLTLSTTSLGYTNVGTLAVTKSGGTYLGTAIHGITSGAQGEATVTGFTAGDQEIYFLALKTGSTLLSSADTAAFITAATNNTGLTVVNLENGSADQTVLKALASIGGSTSTYDVALESAVAPGGPNPADTVLDYSINGYDAASNSQPVVVTDLAAVPEPGSIAAVILGAGTLLLGRRRRKA